MDMNKSFVLRKEDRKPQWHVIDATNQVLGRLSTKIANMLRGKDRPEFTPHEDAGDYVIVINCEKIKLTGDKWDDKMYERYSGWRSGLKKTAAKDVLKKDPAHLIIHSVHGMLPDNKLSDRLIKKLKVYVGANHPHKAQI
jgi:large subunit ribosomal protein L13